MAIKGKKFLTAILCAALSLGAVGCGGTPSGNSSNTDKPTEEEKREMTNHAVFDAVALPDSLWQAPEYFRDEQNDRTDSGIKGTIQAIYYRSDYNGQESYSFAFLGIPEGASADNKVPAVLLVHGGGGTAYWQWVREWVNRGYVALAMDLEGNVPKKDGTSDNMPADLYVDSAYETPHNQNYGDANKPIEQTWMYYAVSTAIRGNSLLHGLDCVNNYKIGVCGVSWGGVITSIITGYDDRFAFSIPIYCSLNLAYGLGGNLTSYYKNHTQAQVWDTDEGIAKVNTPIFFLAMNDDMSAFPDTVSMRAERCKNAQVAFVRNWQHSHSHAFSRTEPYTFADSIVKGGSGLVKILNQPTGEEGTITIQVPENVKVKAYIAYTGDDMSTRPSFSYQNVKVENNTVSYKITDEMRAEKGGVIPYYYILIENNVGQTVSSNLISLD